MNIELERLRGVSQEYKCKKSLERIKQIIDFEIDKIDNSKIDSTYTLIQVYDRYKDYIGEEFISNDCNLISLKLFIDNEIEDLNKEDINEDKLNEIFGTLQLFKDYKKSYLYNE